MSTDTQPETHDDNAVKTTPTESSEKQNVSHGVSPASRTVLNTRQRGVRKANSGSSIPSKTKTRQRAIERSRSSSGTHILSPYEQKQRNSRISSRMKMDSSIDSTNSPTSDDGSVGSYSLGSSRSSNTSSSIVKSEISRINGKAAVDLVAKMSSRESIDPLDNQKPRRSGLRRTGSKSSEITEQLEATSPYLRGRKKLPSEIPIDDSHKSAGSSSVRNTRSKKKSSSPKSDDNIAGASNHSATRKTKSKTRTSNGSKGKQHSSSGKSLRDGDKNKRHSRRSRTPSSKTGSKSPNSETSVDRDKNRVTEEEIMQLLDSTNHDSAGKNDEEMQQKQTRSKRKSKSPVPDPLDASYRERRSGGKHRPQQRRRSISSGAIETTRSSRRHSNEGGRLTRTKQSRAPPARSRSNNIGVDSSGLDSFLKQSVGGSRRKKTSNRSVNSGSKSVSLSGSKSLAGSRSVNTTNSAGNKPRRRHLRQGRSLRSNASPRQAQRYEHPKLYDEDENGTIIESDSDDSDDDNSVEVDLDLATARNNFVQQNLNKELTAKLSKTDELLYSVFPKHIADALRNGQKVAPENHDMVTIFFSDIVGFTDISAKLDPLKISDMLDRLYNSFDALSDYHDVFKVETIGDAYMAVTNLTKEQPDHCKRITEFAVDAIRVANQTLIDADKPSMGFVNIRVGFHSGSVVSNVVGSRNPRYCLFGDTVNTASRMESNSEKNRINCSETSASLLRQQSPRVRIFPRGVIDVKGKGEMNTFWVHREGSFSATRHNNKSTFSNFMEKVRKR